MTGEPGSWINGAAIVRGIVHERLGTAAMNAHLVVADGSGLSRLNRVEAETLTAWLNSFHNDERLGSLFIESLAVGGASGTLEKRLGTAETDGAIVQAKSGYINGVSCLSGYVTRSDGRRRCFSIMINDLTAPVSRAKMLQDRIVRAIALDMHEAAVQLGSD
jgi:D-alanyl-D-alanine carboxypeptidase/D-alanyl-D-alanine-endopeptidase (penicillin-binding protein 4)